MANPLLAGKRRSSSSTGVSAAAASFASRRRAKRLDRSASESSAAFIFDFPNTAPNRSRSRCLNCGYFSYNIIEISHIDSFCSRDCASTFYMQQGGFPSSPPAIQKDEVVVGRMKRFTTKNNTTSTTVFLYRCSSEPSELEYRVISGATGFVEQESLEAEEAAAVADRLPSGMGDDWVFLSTGSENDLPPPPRVRSQCPTSVLFC